MTIEHLIGDYKSFFSDLLCRTDKIGLNYRGLPMSHLLYRVTTIPEYENLRDKLLAFCNEFVETQFNGRAVSILGLKEPLKLTEGFVVDIIELPAPRSVHMYPTGLESTGVVIGKDLPAFIEKNKKSLTGVKDHGQYCQPAFVTFKNEKTVKFYDISLKEIIFLQGWKIAKV